MVKNSRAPSNPLTHYAELNGKVDVRRQRRSLSHEDFGRLVEAARKGKVFRRLSGPDRAMLYEVAAYTGLREGELASLTRTSFDLDANPPTVTVEAATVSTGEKMCCPFIPSWRPGYATGCRRKVGYGRVVGISGGRRWSRWTWRRRGRHGSKR